MALVDQPRGDGQADLSVHGGPDKAVYAYPSEHLAPWSEELEETLSTVGVTEADVCIGDIWEWGDATLEICQPRWPCFKLALHRRRADIQARMRQNGRTGWYLRVLEPGEVHVGSDAAVVRHDPAGLTVADAHTAMGDRHLDRPELVSALAEHDRLSPTSGATPCANGSPDQAGSALRRTRRDRGDERLVVTLDRVGVAPAELGERPVGSFTATRGTTPPRRSRRAAVRPGQRRATPPAVAPPARSHRTPTASTVPAVSGSWRT